MTCAVYYRRDGTPYASMEEWATDLEAREIGRRRVAETELANGKWVSTVWIGHCHSFHELQDVPEDVHLIFETMVFDRNAERPMSELDMERYATEAEAIAGHERMVSKWTEPPVD